MEIRAELFLFFVTLFGGYFANEFDVFRFNTLLHGFLAYLLYFVVTLILALFIMWLGIWAVLEIRERRKPARVHGITLEPRDFGLDQQAARRIGFAINGTPKEVDVRLEAFWFSGKKKPDEMQLRYPLNLTSHRLDQTPDGQYFLATSWKYDMPFTLTMEDGFYGLFVLAGYFKARVSIYISDDFQPCFEILMWCGWRDEIRVKNISEINCDDQLEHIPEEERVDFMNEDMKNWSTVPHFQPNQMYND